MSHDGVRRDEEAATPTERRLEHPVDRKRAFGNDLEEIRASVGHVAPRQRVGLAAGEW